MKFSLQTAALWITQLRCARSKIGQLREPTNGHGKEARSASREPIRMKTSFQGTYLEKEESRQCIIRRPNTRRPAANSQFFSFKKERGGRGQGRQGRVKKGPKLYSVYIPPALEFIGPGAKDERPHFSPSSISGPMERTGEEEGIEETDEERGDRPRKTTDE